ncbi:MAG: class I SAM-dependent methyltransferase [Candidatus Beckwithbacteria bacterium]
MDLNKLNEEFYLKTQEYFNTSRQFYWDGWKKLLPHLQGRTLKVLDLGCGNGRFGKFLAEHQQIEYTGIDNNQYLLDKAAENLPGACLLQRDLTKPWQIKGKFDLVAILGVMHHLPKENRVGLLKQATAGLRPSGILFLSFWRFNQYQKSKIIKDLGDNDYILDWHMGVDAERYCHLYSQKEIRELIKPLKLKRLDNFISDKSNRYLILKA